MSTQVDWNRELDAAIPRGPDRALDDYLAAGRTAVRRRRARTAAVGLAATVVAGVGAWAAAPGPSPAVPAAPAASEGSTPSQTTDVDEATASESATADPGLDETHRAPRTATAEELSLLEGPRRNHLQAGYTPDDGELVVRPGWTVVTFENNPMGATPPATSAGLELTKGGQTVWMLLEWSPDGMSASQDLPGKRFSRFDDWLADQVAFQEGGEGPLVAWTVRGMIATQPGTEVLESVEHPREAAAYGEPAQMVAAKLQLADGSVVFVLAGPDGGAALDPAVLEAPTMKAFLRHLAAQGMSGEGLR